MAGSPRILAKHSTGDKIIKRVASESSMSVLSKDSASISSETELRSMCVSRNSKGLYERSFVVAKNHISTWRVLASCDMSHARAFPYTQRP